MSIIHGVLGLLRSAPTIVVALTFVASACTERDPPLGPECFPEDPWVDAINEAYEYENTPGFIPAEWAQMQYDIGFCDYPPNNTEYLQYESAFPGEDCPHKALVRHCEEVPESGACEQCPEEDMDAALRAQYQDAQDADPVCWDGSSRQIVDYERGCVGKYLTDDGERCCWSAVVCALCPS
jgi:hypothetical protein